MPIIIPESLPATEKLQEENIFYLNERHAFHQDIRPLKIAILNLMPKKIETETQLLRLLSNTPLQLEIELLQMASHKSKNTPSEHLLKYYKTFYDVKEQKFDGMIITGAPVEQIDFEEVDYWKELCEIMEWSKTHVFSTFYICWGAQAGLYYHYGIQKHPLSHKMFGIFEHKVLAPHHPLVRGFDEVFQAPHSRHTEVRVEDIVSCNDLTILAQSDLAGVYLIADKENRNFFVTGHSEYDRDTLKGEYERDLAKGLKIQQPYHYFPANDPSQVPPYIWRSHAHLLYSNWLNYFVYQNTPYTFINESFS